MVLTYVTVSTLFDLMRALLLIFLFWTQVGFSQEALLDSIRKNIREVFQNESVCNSMYESFESTDVSGNNTLIGYKGAVEMGMSRHDSNPFKKMSFFSDGKKHLEEAINNDKENIELRFLRLTIQTYLPAFLGYSGSVQSDKDFVLKNLDSTNEDFREKVLGFISQAEKNGKL